MWSAVVMSGKLYTMKSEADLLDELEFEIEDRNRCDEHIRQGNPVIFVDDLGTLETNFPGMEIVIVERDEDDEGDDDDK